MKVQHGARICSVAFDSEDLHVATGSKDGKLRIINVASGQVGDRMLSADPISSSGGSAC